MYVVWWLWVVQVAFYKLGKSTASEKDWVIRVTGPVQLQKSGVNPPKRLLTISTSSQLC